MTTNEKAAKKIIQPKAGAQRRAHRERTTKRGYCPTGSKPPVPSSGSKVTTSGKKD